MSLQTDLNELLLLKEKSADISNEQSNKLKEIREKINKGETTGDNIRDFVVYYCGEIRPDIEKPFRDIESRVKANAEVLVIHMDKKPPEMSDPPKPNPMMYEHFEYQLALLKSDGLKLDIRKGLDFPTGTYALHHGHFEEEWAIVKKDINLSLVECFGMSRDIIVDPVIRETMIGDSNPTILIGSDVTGYYKRNSHRDISYVEGLNLLGKKAPLDFQEKYDKRLILEKESIIEELLEITLMKDSNKYRRKIEQHLNRAVRLGMHTQELTLQGHTQGITIDVSRYIRALCMEYKINM